MTRSHLLWLAPLGLLAALVIAPAPASAAAAATTSCLSCHASSDFVDQASVELVKAFAEGVHAEVGISCQDCHGGNPDPRLAEDPAAAMDEHFAGAPFTGAPARTAIPALCGHCHSDPAYMRRFRTDVRVDQEKEYWTSPHGVALRHGDTRVATCIDCHGVHGILRPANTRSPVYPTHVAETCRRCHGDAARMAPYKAPDGRPLPIDQYALWRQSVHARALLEKEDLSAPTCNDCHGDHGATPPGVDSISYVCGRCHGREADLFRASAKRAGFESHNDLLRDAGGEGCAACHQPPDPQASLKGVHALGECTSCHGNHAVITPSVAMLSPLPETPCAFCHEGAGPLADEVLEPEATRRHYEEVKAALLAEAATTGQSGDARFDWLVDQARGLAFHTLPAERSESGQAELRPEVARLFAKFRIGKTYFTYDDPKSGKPVQAPVVRCAACHSAESSVGAEPVGLATAKDFIDKTHELTALTARAERLLLAARRGGVETREASIQVGKAVDAQIESEVLVHTFSAAPDGAFAKKHDEGVGFARAALEAGKKALAELGFRRRGLVVSLIFIAAVLVALGLKIRQLSP